MTEAEGKPGRQRRPIPGGDADVVRIKPDGEPLGGNHCSESQLIETASLNLAHRWYLGYVLDEALPDHSTLPRIRQRLGIDVFQRFFERIVDLCQEAGLVWGHELYFDATKVEANADLDSLLPRFYHEAKTHVADLF